MCILNSIQLPWDMTYVSLCIFFFFFILPINIYMCLIVRKMSNFKEKVFIKFIFLPPPSPHSASLNVQHWLIYTTTPTHKNVPHYPSNLYMNFIFILVLITITINNDDIIIILIWWPVVLAWTMHCGLKRIENI